MNAEVIVRYILIFIPVYLFGAIPWGFVIGKINGINILEQGSGNIGATNVRRVLGKKWGVICFNLDFLKGLIPVLGVSILQKTDIIPENLELATVTAGFATVAGHMWSIYLKFKGGKGIATSAGILAAMAPFSLLASGLTWIIVFQTSRYVSLASITAAITLPVSAFSFSLLKWYIISNSVLIFLILIAFLAIFRHSSNIKRLLNGTENRFTKKDDLNDANNSTQ